MGGSPFRFLGDSLAIKFLALLPTLPTLVSQFTKSPMAFYIDTTSNHLHQTQRSIRKVPPYLSHISSFEGLLDRYPVPTSPWHLPSSLLDIHQYYRKDGSNKQTMVAPIKQPYSRPSFKKLFQEIRTTKNFKRQKYQTSHPARATIKLRWKSYKKSLFLPTITKWNWSTRLRSQLCPNTLTFYTPPHLKIWYSPHPIYEEAITFQIPSPNY